MINVLQHNIAQAQPSRNVAQSPMGISFIVKKDFSICETILSLQKSDFSGVVLQAASEQNESSITFFYSLTQLLNKGFHKGTSVQETVLFRAQNASYSIAVETSFPFEDNDVALLRLDDISKYVTSLQMSQEHSREFELIADNTFDWELWIDVNNTIRYSSPACKNIIGYTKDELYERPNILVDLFNEKQQQLHQHIFSAHEQIILPIEEHSITTKDGENRWLSFAGKPFYNQQGSYLGRRLSIRDVTYLRKQREEAEKSQRLLQTALEHSPVGVLIAESPNVEIRFANMAALSTRNLPKDQLEHLPVENHTLIWQTYELDGTTPYKSENLPLSRAVLCGEHIRDEELIIRRSDGQTRLVSASAAPVFNDNKELIGGIVVFPDITERKKNEQERQQLLQMFLQGPTILFTWSGTQGFPVEYVSPNVLDILGYSPEELLHDNIPYAEIVHPDDVNRIIAETIKNIELCKQRFQHTYRVRHKEGHYLYVQDYTTAFYDKQGNLTSMSGYLLDITPRLQAESSKVLMTERMNIILNSLNTIVSVVDIESYEVLFINHVGEQLFGNVRGKQCWKVLQAGQIAPCSFCPHNRLFDEQGKPSGVVVEEEYNLLTSRWYEQRSRAILWDNGKWAHVQISTDITDRKNAEERERTLRRQLRAIINHVPSYIYVKDSDGRFLMVNSAVAKVFGTKPEEVIGKRDEDYGATQQQAEGYRRADKEAIIHNKTVVVPEEQVLRTDGTLGWFQTVKVPLEYPGYEKGVVLGVSVDITERREMEQRLREERDRAEVANRAKSEFLSNMSHEIRTPMNAIIGFTDLMLKSAPNPEQKTQLQIVYDSAIALLELVNDILDYSRMETNAIALVFETVDIYILVEQLIEMVRYSAESKKLSLKLIIHSHVPRHIKTDPIRIRQVLMNLLTNAVKFTHHGTVECSISASPVLESSKTLLLFSVRDTGIGIAPEDQTRIFEAFTQADTSSTRLYGGTGLGLTIANKILQHFNTSLDLESEPGKGSRFYFSLVVETLQELIHEELSPRFTSVLIADDDRESAELTAEYCRQLGVETFLATNGIEALSKIQQQTFSAVLIECDMPFMDGYEVVRYVRSNMGFSSREVPIIMMHSSQSNVVLRQEYQSTWQVHAFLEKPLSVSALQGVFKQIIASYSHISTHTVHATKQEFILLADNNPSHLLELSTIIREFLPNAELLEARNGTDATSLYKIHKPTLVFMNVELPIMDGYQASRIIREELLDKNICIIGLTDETMPHQKELCLQAGMNDYLAKPYSMQNVGLLIQSHLHHNRA